MTNETFSDKRVNGRQGEIILGDLKQYHGGLLPLAFLPKHNRPRSLEYCV